MGLLSQLLMIIKTVIQTHADAWFRYRALKKKHQFDSYSMTAVKFDI